MTKHGAIVSKSVIRLKDGCCARFTNNGFTMSVFTFSKSIECFLHAYYRVFSLNIFLISMVKSGGYIWLSRISTSCYICQNKCSGFVKTVGQKNYFSLAALN